MAQAPLDRAGQRRERPHVSFAADTGHVERSAAGGDRHERTRARLSSSSSRTWNGRDVRATAEQQPYAAAGSGAQHGQGLGSAAYDLAGSGVRHDHGHRRVRSHGQALLQNVVVDGPVLARTRSMRNLSGDAGCCNDCPGFTLGLLMLIAGIFTAVISGAAAVVPVAVLGGLLGLTGTMLMIAFRGDAPCCT